MYIPKYCIYLGFTKYSFDIKTGVNNIIDCIMSLSYTCLYDIFLGFLILSILDMMYCCLPFQFFFSSWTGVDYR